MRIYAVNLHTGAQQQPIRIWRSRRIELAVDKQGDHVKRVGARRSGMELIRTGADITVTNYGVAQRIAIAGQPLTHGVRYAWLENQDLQIGDHLLLRWTPDLPLNLWGRGWQLAWLLLLALLLLPFVAAAIALSGPSAAASTDQPLPTAVATLSTTPLPAAAPTATPTSMPTSTPTATAPPLPAVPTYPPAVFTQVPVAPADSVAVSAAQHALDLTATATAAAGATAVAARAAPCVPAPPTQVNWDPAISMWVEPACVRPGDQYWALVEAQWLSGEQYNGYHHVFVDVKDKDGHRSPYATFVMSWPDGQCRVSIGQGTAEPIEHGNSCPMFSPAGSYDVRVEGLPSDVVHGLGLGGAHSATSPVDYMTSFFLLFQRMTYEG